MTGYLYNSVRKVYIEKQVLKEKTENQRRCCGTDNAYFQIILG